MQCFGLQIIKYQTEGESGAGVSPSTFGISLGAMLWEPSPSASLRQHPRYSHNLLGCGLSSGQEQGLRGSDVNAVTQMTRGKESKREKEASPKSWFWGVGELGEAELQRLL